MTRSQEEFNNHLAQALKYLYRCHRHMKTWAILFIGGQRARLGDLRLNLAYTHSDPPTTNRERSG